MDEKMIKEITVGEALKMILQTLKEIQEQEQEHKQESKKEEYLNCEFVVLDDYDCCGDDLFHFGDVVKVTDGYFNTRSLGEFPDRNEGLHTKEELKEYLEKKFHDVPIKFHIKGE